MFAAWSSRASKTLLSRSSGTGFQRICLARWDDWAPPGDRGRICRFFLEPCFWPPGGSLVGVFAGRGAGESVRARQFRVQWRVPGAAPGWFLVWFLAASWLVPGLVPGWFLAGSWCGSWLAPGWFLVWFLAGSWLVPGMVPAGFLAGAPGWDDDSIS